MSLRWTAGALADLEAIHAYQKAHWPAMLAPFEARLTEFERRITEFPLTRSRAATRRSVAVFRDFPYHLFYRAEAGAIDVLAVRHTSRRPPFE